MRSAKILLPACAALCLATPAFAATITYTTPIGNQATNTLTDAGTGLKAEGFHADFGSSSLVAENLFIRNEPTVDVGLGICSTGETCGSGTGSGDFNEISNENVFEVLRLTLPAGWEWDSLSLSSLDRNDSTDTALWERGQLLYGSNANPFLGVTPFQNFVGTANSLWTIDLTAISNAPYLFLVAFDWTEGNNTNNDYLLQEVVLQGGRGDVPVPEPATLTLLGLGMSAAGVRLRRRRTN